MAILNKLFDTDTEFGGNSFSLGSPWGNMRRAASAQEGWIGSAANERRKGYDNALNEWRTRFAPYAGFGGNRVASWEKLLSDPSSVTSTPGYDFRLNQGREGLENSAISKGGLLSGNAMRGITQYGQDYASNEYDKALAREMAGAQFGATVDTNVGNALANLEVGKGASNAKQYGDLSNYAFWHEQQGMDQAQQWMGFLRGALGGGGGGGDKKPQGSTYGGDFAGSTGYGGGQPYQNNAFLSYNQPAYGFGGVQPDYVTDWNRYNAGNMNFRY